MTAENEPLLDRMLRSWLGSLAGCVLVGMSCSIFGKMRFGAWLSWCVVLPWVLHCFRGAPRPRWRAMAPSFLIVFLGALISLTAGLHAFLDSLTYRIPQMLFWMQEGHPWWIPHVDPRINGMPHVWPYVMAPCYMLFGLRGTALPSYVSFFVLSCLLVAMARRHAEPGRARWIALVFACSPGFVLQASSTDNSMFAATLVLASLHYASLCPTTVANIAWSAIALALAAGTKPQLSALGLPWALWFLTHVPLRRLSLRAWATLLPLIPLLVALSPLPSFAMSLWHVGSLSPTVSTAGLDAGAFLGRMLRSMLLFGLQVFALPLNPVAGTANRWGRTVLAETGAGSFLRLQDLGIQPIILPEVASLGIVASSALVVGLWRGRRNANGVLRRAMVWGFAMMFLAFGLTGAGTVGRSFIGFLVMAIPQGMAGLAGLRTGTLKILGHVACAVALCLMVLNPHMPLVPRKAIEASAQYLGLHGRLGRLIGEYYQFRSRAEAGVAIAERVPAAVATIGVLVENETPLHRLWRGGRPMRVLPVALQSTASQLHKMGVVYLIVRHDAVEDGQGRLSEEFLSNLPCTVLASLPHQSKRRLGPQMWHLVRVSPP